MNRCYRMGGENGCSSWSLERKEYNTLKPLIHEPNSPRLIENMGILSLVYTHFHCFCNMVIVHGFSFFRIKLFSRV
jgi:hypothetical protein